MNHTTPVRATLAAFGRRYRRIRLLGGGALVLLVLLLPLPAVTMLDRFVLLPDWQRYLLSGVYAAAAAYALFRFWRRCWRDWPQDLSLAFAIGDGVPSLHQSLAASVELEAEVGRPGVSDGLIAAQAREAGKLAAALDVASLLPASQARRLALRAAFGLLINAGLLVAFPQYPLLLARFLAPFANLPRASGLDITVTPGSAGCGDGESLVVEARTSDPAVLARLGFYRSAPGAPFHRFEMERVAPGHFKLVLPGLREDFGYYLSEGLHRTARYGISVARRPRLEAFIVACEYPKYTGLPPSRQTLQEGSFSAWKGSQVSLTVSFDIPVAEVRLRRDAGENRSEDLALALAADGRSASLSFKLDTTFNYEVVAFGRSSRQENGERLRYRAEAVVDRAPVVTILQPPVRVRVGRDEVVELACEARDEFAIVSTRLFISRSGGKPEYRALNTGGLSTKLVSGGAKLAPCELGARPGDELELRVEAVDNAGQTGTSSPVILEIPVAPGDPESRKLAEALAPASAALNEVRANWQKAGDAFEGVSKILAARAHSWTPQLDRAFVVLRPSHERLLESLTRAAGLVGSVREAATENAVRILLDPVVQSAMSCRDVVAPQPMERILVDIREDFKGTGTVSAAAVAGLLKDWRPLAISSADFTETWRRVLLFRDLAERSGQLVAGQQSIIVEACQPAIAQKVLQRKQEIVLEEVVALLKDLSSLPKLPSGQRRSDEAEVLSAWSEREIPVLTVAVAELRRELKTDFNLARIQEFAPRLIALREQLVPALSSQEMNLATAEMNLVATLADRRSVGKRLAAVAAALGRTEKAVAIDPLDKIEEREQLTPIVAEARFTCERFRRIRSEVWQMVAELKGGGTFPEQRRDLAWLGLALDSITAEKLNPLESTLAKIVATFSRNELSAVPQLVSLRSELKALQETLHSHAADADALERDRSLAELSTRLRFLVEQERANPAPVRLAAALQANASALTALAAVFQGARDEAMAKSLTNLSDSLLPARKAVANPEKSPLPLFLVTAWQELAELAGKGSATGHAGQEHLTVKRGAYGERLTRLARDFEACAQLAATVSNSGNVVGIKEATATKDKPSTTESANNEAERVASSRLVLALAETRDRLSGLIAALTAEAATRLGKEAGEAARFRAEALEAEQIDLEAAAPGSTALELMESTADKVRRAALGSFAAASCRETATRLLKFAPFVAGGAVVERQNGVGGDLPENFLRLQNLSQQSREAFGLASRVLALSSGEGVAGASSNVAALVPAFGLGDRAAAAATLDRAARNYFILASLEEAYAAELIGASSASRMVRERHAQVLRELPGQLEKLLVKIAAALPAADRLDANLFAALKEVGERCRLAAKIAPAAAANPSLDSGRNVSAPLVLTGAIAEVPKVPAVLKISLQELRRREVERKAVATFLGDGASAVLAKTVAMAGEYDAEDVRCLQAFDRCLEVAKKRFAKLALIFNGGIVAEYHIDDFGVMKDFTTHETNARFIRDPLAALKAPTHLMLADEIEGMDKTDPVKMRAAIFREYWRCLFFGSKYHYERWVGVKQVLTEQRSFYFRISKGDEGKKDPVEVSFAGHWQYLAKLIRDLGLPQADRAIAKARASKPTDMAALEEYKNFLLEMAVEFDKIANEALPETRFFERRHAWATKVSALRNELRPHAKRVQELATAAGWKPAVKAAGFGPGINSPAGVKPDKSKSGKSGKTAKGGESGKNSAGRLASATSAPEAEDAGASPGASRPALTLFAAADEMSGLQAELERLEVFALMAGTNDPNTDPAKAKEELKDKPKSGCFAASEKYASRAGEILAAIAGFEGEASTSTSAAATTGLAAAVDQSLQKAYRRIGDTQVLTRSLKPITAVATALPDLQVEAGKAAFAKTEESEPLRRRLAAAIAPHREALRQVNEVLVRRAQIDGWKVPTVDRKDPVKRQSPLPDRIESAKDLAQLAFALSVELDGLWTYDLLCGEPDANFARAMVAERLKLPPSSDCLKRAVEVSRIVASAFAEEQKKQAAVSADPQAVMSALDRDAEEVTQACLLFAEIQALEPTLRQAVAAAEGTSAESLAGFDSNQRSGLYRRAEAAGLTRAALSWLPPELIASATGGRPLEAPGASAVSQLITDVRNLFSSGKRDETAMKLFFIAETLRSQATSTRSGAEALRGSSPAAAPSDARATPASVTGGALPTQEVNPQLLACEELWILQESLADNLCSRSEAAAAMLLVSNHLNAAAVKDADAQGATWLEDIRRKASAALAAKFSSFMPTGIAELENGEARLSSKDILGHLTLRPPGRDPRAANYGRLPGGDLERLQVTRLERMPPELREAWNAYIDVLRQPPASYLPAAIGPP